MKYVLKLEELGLFLFFSMVYFHFYPGTWGLFLSLFFVPDVSFLFFLFTKKAGAIAYNIFHHKGIMTIVIAAGYLFQLDLLMQVGFIFMTHSCFDRVAGYGLKYFDSFDHTHLGWVGKSKGKQV
jgi:hypothetical protein